jgi:hypothetical protein
LTDVKLGTYIPLFTLCISEIEHEKDFFKQFIKDFTKVEAL